MAGIYIHIPFCKQACSYCNFHFSTSLKNKAALIESIKDELLLRSEETNEGIKSIYFGGGTPSLLSQSELSDLLTSIYQNYSVEDNVEVTLEANPDDLSKSKLKELKASGINRLSIGVQSFYDEDLQFMDRAHNAIEAKNAILYSQDIGFANINIDLIFGVHSLTDEKWLENLKLFKELNLSHLSAYSLTVEENTKLIYQINKGLIGEIDDEKAYRQYSLLQNELNNGFKQYELSNYCKVGYRSLHNSSYWNLSNYLGFGPSAHSFNCNVRRWNISNNMQYIKNVKNQTTYFELEKLTEVEKYHDYLIIRLRTTEGINYEDFKSHFSLGIQKHFFSALNQLNQSLIIRDAKRVFIDQKLLFTSDEVIRELMVDFSEG